MRKVERLINLTAMLMNTRRPLTAEQIRAALYKDQSDAAFRRMFERDKEELREIGVPVERVHTDVWEVEEGYLINRDEATIPDLDLTPDEHAALWLAAGAWQGQIGGEDARRALAKLSAAGGDTGAHAPAWMAPRLDLSSPAVPLLYDAISRRKRVTFAYRTGGAGEPETRTVEPHALSNRGGWYLTGYDTAREAIRHFKLSRVEGNVKVAKGKDADFEPPASPSPGVPHGPWEGEVRMSARVAFSPETAFWAERRTGAQRVEERDDGWVVLEIPVADAGVFVTWTLAFAEEAEVLEPKELRDDVIAALKAAV